eukprot:TRINITY_DN109607_c0_g1_i1.p1 TRINITY_DN109607_c0_g1~~TRINITY_DN109607_c0_g1_i1.p1  ORF type:complete len:275 (-),score=34.77 TRINITY_DN109607_c0_g1_i1:99-923(-)
MEPARSLGRESIHNTAASLPELYNVWWKPSDIERAPAWQKALTAPGIMVASTSKIFAELLKHRSFKFELLNAESGQKFGEQKYRSATDIKILDFGKLRGERCYIFHVRRFTFVISQKGLQGWVNFKNTWTGNKRWEHDDKSGQLQCEPMLAGWMMIETETWTFQKLMLTITITNSAYPAAIGCSLRPVLKLQAASDLLSRGQADIIKHASMDTAGQELADKESLAGPYLQQEGLKLEAANDLLACGPADTIEHASMTTAGQLLTDSESLTGAHL